MRASSLGVGISGTEGDRVTLAHAEVVGTRQRNRAVNSISTVADRYACSGELAMISSSIFRICASVGMSRSAVFYAQVFDRGGLGARQADAAQMSSSAPRMCSGD
jgi:hypothetical protein